MAHSDGHEELLWTVFLFGVHHTSPIPFVAGRKGRRGGRESRHCINRRQPISSSRSDTRRYFSPSQAWLPFVVAGYISLGVTAKLLLFFLFSSSRLQGKCRLRRGKKKVPYGRRRRKWGKVSAIICYFFFHIPARLLHLVIPGHFFLSHVLPPPQPGRSLANFWWWGIWRE